MTLPAPPYPPRAAVDDAVDRALAEDLLPLGDLTASLLDPAAQGHLVIAAREPGVIAGQWCAETAFARVGPDLKVDWRRPDGAAVAPGDVVATVSGELRAILTAERTALNFLGHLSGVATLTAAYVAAVRAVDPRVRILDTRKTTPGLRALEKAAVRAGGGNNHRASLSDAVLIKDNHLGALGITEAVSRARSLWPGRMVEVECESLQQVDEATRARATVLLLDNMSPEEVAECVALVHRIEPASPPLLEVSGRVSLERAPLYAAVGVDLISVGALTHSVAVLDLGLDLVEGDG